MHYKMDKIMIGEESNIQDNVTVHVDAGVPTQIGRDSFIAAGSLITPGTEIPPCTLVMGSPGKVVRTLKQDQIPIRDGMYLRYINLVQNYREANSG